MSRFSRGVVLGALCASALLCAYTFLLNDKAKRSLREAAVSVGRSADRISGYWDDLFGKGEGEVISLEEHQQAVRDAWAKLGY